MPHIMEARLVVGAVITPNTRFFTNTPEGFPNHVLSDGFSIASNEEGGFRVLGIALSLTLCRIL